MELEHKFPIVDIVSEKVNMELNKRYNLFGQEVTLEEKITKLWKSLLPLNTIESTFLLMSQMEQFSPLGLQDFLAQTLYILNIEEVKRIMNMHQESIEMLTFIDDNGTENNIEDLELFRRFSIIVRYVNRELKKLNLDTLKVFKELRIEDEFLKVLLSGKKEDFIKYKGCGFNFQEGINEQTKRALAIFIQLYSKIKEKNIPKTEKEISYILTSINAIITYRTYIMVQHEFPEEYIAWRNYVVDNQLAGYDCKSSNSMQPLLHWIELVKMNYKNYLNNLFDIIYNEHYTMEYRKGVRQLLKNKEVAAILPYYEEYCKEHNISPDKYYYLGDIPEKNEESSGLSYIDSESPDKDTEQHFGLALKSNQVEYLYNELKGTYLDASTDIRLFCYRLTGKGKPDKIEKLKWVSDDDSLAVFIKHLGVSKNKCWQKNESFFGNKNENLKSRYHRLTKQKGKLKVNDINLTNLDNILASIKTNA